MDNNTSFPAPRMGLYFVPSYIAGVLIEEAINSKGNIKDDVVTFRRSGKYRHCAISGILDGDYTMITHWIEERTNGLGDYEHSMAKLAHKYINKEYNKLYIDIDFSKEDPL